jgi:hypothetical protein
LPTHKSDLLSLKFEKFVDPQVLLTQIEKSVGNLSIVPSKGESVFEAHIKGLHGSGHSTETINLTSVLSETDTVGVAKLAWI